MKKARIRPSNNLELTELDIPIALSNQLKNGNRLRPLLFAWGYALSSPVNSLNLHKKVIQESSYCGDTCQQLV